MAGDALFGHLCLLRCQSNGHYDIIFTFTGWQWRSISTSTPGWKDAAVMKWKLRWTRWLRMLVYHISGRILLRTCQVRLYCLCVCRHVLDVCISASDWIMQRCKFSFWCMHQFLCLIYSFPLGRNIICRLSFLFRNMLPCYAFPLPAHVHAAVSTSTCSVPVCHKW